MNFALKLAKEELSALRLEDVQHYLTSRGWQMESAAPSAKATTYRFPNEPDAEVLLPRSRDLADYALRMGDVAEMVAAVEHRPIREVLVDLSRQGNTMNRVHDSFLSLTQQFRTRVQAIYGSRLKAVFVFGSYARGDAQDESDVDFLIVLDQFDRYGEEVDRISSIMSDLSLVHGVSISEVFVSERDWLTHQTPFLNNVRSEAIPI